MTGQDTSTFQLEVVGEGTKSQLTIADREATVAKAKAICESLKAPDSIQSREEATAARKSRAMLNGAAEKVKRLKIDAIQSTVRQFGDDMDELSRIFKEAADAYRGPLEEYEASIGKATERRHIITIAVKTYDESEALKVLAFCERNKIRAERK